MNRRLALGVFLNLLMLFSVYAFAYGGFFFILSHPTSVNDPVLNLTTWFFGAPIYAVFAYLASSQIRKTVLAVVRKKNLEDYSQPNRLALGITLFLGIVGIILYLSASSSPGLESSRDYLNTLLIIFNSVVTLAGLLSVVEKTIHFFKTLKKS